MKIKLILASTCALLGTAIADPPHIVIEPPQIFLPGAPPPLERGYYQTPEGYYYHYDADRRGWHYGHNHDEGLRYDRERERHRRHWWREHDEDRD